MEAEKMRVVLNKTNIQGDKTERSMPVKIGQFKLSKDVLKYNFLAWKWICRFHLFPLKFDPETGCFSGTMSTSRRDRWAFKLWSLFAAIRLIHCIVVTVSAIGDLKGGQSKGQSSKSSFESNVEEDLKLFRLLFLILVSFSCTVLFYGYYSVLGANADSFVILYNELVNSLPLTKTKGSTGQVKDNSKQTRESRKSTQFFQWLNNIKGKIIYSPKEYLIIYMPFSIYALMLALPMQMIADPDFPLLWTSAVKIDLKMTGTLTDWPQMLLYAGLAASDFSMYLFFVSLVYYIYFIFLFLHTTMANIGEVKGQLENPSRSEDAVAVISEMCKSLQKLRISVLLFNLSLSHVVYNSKLVCLTGGIIGGFGAIKFRHNSVLAVMFAIYFVQGLMIYNVSYSRAYRVASGIEEIRVQILKTISSSNSPRQGRGQSLGEIRRILRAIPSLGVQDGGFNRMERISAFVFNDYVFQQIIALLLTF